jgi:hypothetical protein
MRYLEENVKPRIPTSNKPYYECLDSLREECLKKCLTERERNQVIKNKSYAVLEKWLLEEGRTRVGCDLSCNINTGVRICPVALVIEDLRLRRVPHASMTSLEMRHALEMLLREEEEFLKLQMYRRDTRFRDLIREDSGHRGELHKTIIDMLHCPMRTNEKVLNLLYEEVTQGAHKAECTATLCALTTALRRVGELPPSFTHKFEKKNTKVLEKIKLPYDQSRKIFSIHQLHGLREMVHIAVVAKKRREEWMTFLYHYVRVNERLHSTLEYTEEDVAELEIDIDAAYGMLISTIGGRERGVTNYFHYLGSGHIIWMVKRYGNLWRFCNEGAESMNGMASKRYNMFNNKGGYKSSCKDAVKQKCAPFEVLGDWLARLSMWHIGTADTLFALESTNSIVWNENSAEYVIDLDSKDYEVSDSDWSPVDLVCGDSSSEDDYGSSDADNAEDSEDDDMAWCGTVPTLQTWETSIDTGTLYSKRNKFQQMPLRKVPCVLTVE